MSPMLMTAAEQKKTSADRTLKRTYLIGKFDFVLQVAREFRYIDLIPVLDELYMDRNSFLSPIRNVRIEYPFRYNSDNQ